MNRRKKVVVVAPIIIVLLIGWILLSSNSVSSNSEQEQIFQEANQSYQNEDYEQAINHYKELLTQDVQGAHVHNNLASSYLHTGDVGRSIVHFEKAVQLDHYDSDIRRNLDRVRKDNDLEIVKLSFWQDVTHLLSVKHWIVLTSLICIILSALLVLQLTKQINLSLNLHLMLTLVTAGFAVLTITSVRSQQDRVINKAIVINIDSSLRVSPFTGADEIVALRPGEVVTIDSKQEHKTYIKVNLSSGKSGWLKTNEIETIN